MIHQGGYHEHGEELVLVTFTPLKAGELLTRECEHLLTPDGRIVGVEDEGISKRLKTEEGWSTLYRLLVPLVLAQHTYEPNGHIAYEVEAVSWEDVFDIGEGQWCQQDALRDWLKETVPSIEKPTTYVTVWFWYYSKSYVFEYGYEYDGGVSFDRVLGTRDEVLKRFEEVVME